MASTFRELYDDFRDSIKVYTEKLDVTEMLFMRYLTRGMQVFQRETEYMETWLTVTKDSQDRFQVPNDSIHIVGVLDDSGNEMMLTDFQQFRRLLGLAENDYMETPVDYSMRLPTEARVVSTWNRVFHFYPDYTKDSITVHYIPDMEAISRSSNQWTAWFAADAFETYFNTASLSPSFAPFEETFLDYALYRYFKTQGEIKHAQMYMQEFRAGIKRGTIEKPRYFREGRRPYQMAPYS